MKRKIAIRIFNCFLKIYGAGPKPKHKHRNSYKFPDHRNWISVKEHNNMHSLDQACTDNLSLAANISDSAIFPFWKWLYVDLNVDINGFKWFRFIASLCPQSFLFTRNKLLKKPRLYCISFLLTPSSTFPSLPSPSVFVVLDLLPIRKESLIAKVSFERVLHNHLLNPGYPDPWLIFSKPLKNVFIFLLLQCLELCLKRKTFLSTDECFLIPI